MSCLPSHAGEEQPEGEGGCDREGVALFCLVLDLASPESFLVLSVNESLILNGTPWRGRGPDQCSPYVLATRSAGDQVTQA